MTTTNVLTLMLRDAGLKKPGDVHQLPVEKNRAELMDFGQVLERLGTGVASETVGTKVDNSQTKATESLNAREDDVSVKTEEFGSKISEKIKSKEPETVEEEVAEEAMGQFYQEVVSLLCTTLNITPEELMNGMEELGLNVGDLLEPSKLANLFVHFGNDVSVTDILMSEDFQIAKNQIAEFEVALSTELNVTDEELKSLLETFEQKIEWKDVLQQVDEEVVLEHAELNDDTKVQTIHSETDSTENQVVTETTEEPADGKRLQQQMGENGNTNAEDERENQNSLKEVKVEYEPNNRNEIVRDDVNGQTVRQTTVTNSDGTVVQETVRVVDLQNLVSEVTEFVRLTTGNEFSKIEMQINPANLGKMIVEVSSANGEVTTKIIAQTEAGKEAIESNINQMRTNLEQQGVKVAAVEVTVESHAFEQNLQGESSNEQEQLMKEQQENNKKHQMNLNLNELTLDDLSGLMSEEEMLTVRMMRENGNKIDLTV